MTPDEIKGILRGVGLCGESDGKSACLLTKDHVGTHGFQTPAQQCESVRDGYRCLSTEGHVGCHRSDGDGWSRAWSK